MKGRAARTDAAAPAETGELISPGMATLLRGNGGIDTQSASSGGNRQQGEPGGKEEGRTALTPAGAEARPNPLDPDELAVRRLYQASLFFADVLLVGLGAWLSLAPGRRFAWPEVVLCSLALVCGAWLACLALWMEPP